MDYESRILKKAVRLIKEDKVEQVAGESSTYDMWEVEGDTQGLHTVKRHTEKNKFSCTCEFNTRHVEEGGHCSHIVAVLFKKGIPHLASIIESDLLDLMSEWRSEYEDLKSSDSDEVGVKDLVKARKMGDCIDDLEEVLISRGS